MEKFNRPVNDGAKNTDDSENDNVHATVTIFTKPKSEGPCQQCVVTEKYFKGKKDKLRDKLAGLVIEVVELDSTKIEEAKKEGLTQAPIVERRLHQDSSVDRVCGASLGVFESWINETIEDYKQKN